MKVAWSRWMKQLKQYSERTSAVQFSKQSRFFVLVFIWLGSVVRSAEHPQFFRGLNLNGPAVTIDGKAWEGSESKTYVCTDRAFENQQIPLSPAVDPELAVMIRSSRYGGSRVELQAVPPGMYTAFLYVWEDNNAETYSIAINGKTVLKGFNSGKQGNWKKLGPWQTTVNKDQTLLITSNGGTANFSGVELWQGSYDGLGEPIREEDLAFFETRIRPLLVTNCYECHSAESQQAEGDFLADSRATIRRGGSRGAAVMPGDIDHSVLIQAVQYTNEDMQMPPDGKLSDTEIADLKHWVSIGAPDPRSTATKHLGKQIDVAAAREFWSLKPIANPPVPYVNLSEWPHNDIDRFVLAEQEKYLLEPTGDANKRALIRRATYDLIGLPPTPQEVDAFLVDGSDKAFSTVVDRLLTSPRYGERWGRFWLDVVRYADTAGDNSDFPIPEMHRYRDWVVEAFNRDLPYDEFVKDQLAGDLRDSKTETERQQRVIATGYVANARRFGSRVDDYPQHLTIEDTIDNLGRTFLGMTVSCARCHDHKFDPITNGDYYALYGIFHSTRYPWPGIELDQKQRNFIPLVASDKVADAEKELETRDKEQRRLDKEVSNLSKALKKADNDEKKDIEQKLKHAGDLSKNFLEQPLLFETAYAITESQTREDVAIQLKGNPSQLGDVIPRHFLTVLGGQEVPSNLNVSGREQLAKWIMDKDNPLTARVMINRIWQHHFGRGLVSTPNDFGKQGSLPTHAELLDYLAMQFRKSGWSIKAMHRLIMNSHTYQQSSSRDPKTIAKDPANEMLAGFSRLRLDAESLRDTFLVLGGNLDLSPAGPHPFPAKANWKFTQHNPFKEIYETNHRSIYLMTQRIQRHPFLGIFDGADPSTSTATRFNSTTPLQALYLMNDPFFHTQSSLFAERILNARSDKLERVSLAYELLLTREPTAEEQHVAIDFLSNAKTLLLKSGGNDQEADFQAWHACFRGLFRLNEFVYLD